MGVITDKQMQAKPSTKDKWLTETGPRGHGRFTARIGKSGEKLFYFRYTASDGARVTLPIGAYDPTAKLGLTLAQARARCGELSKLYQNGAIDLREYLDAELKLETAQRAAEQARLDAEKLNFEQEQAAQKARLRVSELFQRWATVDLIRRKDGGAEIARMFKKDVLPKIGELPVEDVRKGHITEVTDALLARGVNRMAKQIFSLVRQMFRFAVDRDIIEFDPTASLRKVKIGGCDVERDRVLSEKEIRLLALQLPKAGLIESTEAAVWIALSTCCRIGELLQAKWEHVDLENQTWLIPSENSKNRKPHTIYLSTFSAQQFLRIRNKVIASLGVSKNADRENFPKWVFPSRTGDKSVCTKTITKQLSDRQRVEKAPMSRRAKSDYIDKLVLPEGHWGPHDLRRTGATLMVSLGVLPEVAERCLNHTEQNKMKRIYQRHSYESEMREAWQQLGIHLGQLTKIA